MGASSKALLRAVEEALDAVRVDAPRGYEVRASALPFCGRAMAISAALKEQQRLPDSETDYSTQCIFTAGHGLHSVTQDWLGREGVLWGDWKCQGPAFKPKGHVPEALQHAVTQYLKANVCGELGPRGYRPKTRCPRCDKVAWGYEEVTLTDPVTGIGAHTDGVFPQFESLLEIKSMHIDKHRKLTVPILKHWVYQASLYAGLLEEQTGIRMKRILLAYMDRSFFKRKLFVRPVIRDTLASTRAQLQAARKQIKLKVLPSRICSSASMAPHMNCQFDGTCFSPAVLRILGWSSHER